MSTLPKRSLLSRRGAAAGQYFSRKFSTDSTQAYLINEKLRDMLGWTFVKLILFANLVAWPPAWYGMSQWLQGFAYRTSLSVFIFLATAVVALLIALVAVSFQTLKAAPANPIESLRYE